MVINVCIDDTSGAPDWSEHTAQHIVLLSTYQTILPSIPHHTLHITTGSVGIGLYVAQALALHGAKVIIVGRSQQRCTEYVMENPMYIFIYTMCIYTVSIYTICIYTICAGVEANYTIYTTQQYTLYTCAYTGL